MGRISDTTTAAGSRRRGSIGERTVRLNQRELLGLGGATLAATADGGRPDAPARRNALRPDAHQQLQDPHRAQLHAQPPRQAPGGPQRHAGFPIEGDLAESWTQPDETTYVFKLRRGVRWQAKPPAVLRPDPLRAQHRGVGERAEELCAEPRLRSRWAADRRVAGSFVMRGPARPGGRVRC
jgi:hypothetical protein